MVQIPPALVGTLIDTTIFETSVQGVAARIAQEAMAAWLGVREDAPPVRHQWHHDQDLAIFRCEAIDDPGTDEVCGGCWLRITEEMVLQSRLGGETVEECLDRIAAVFFRAKGIKHALY